MEYEANRQIDLVESGQRVVQETRHWNEADGRTSSMRSKEEAMDYRYFPEPDLVATTPSDAWIDAVRNALPALPADRRSRLADATGGELSAGSEMIVTVVNLDLDALVMRAVEAGADARRAISRAANDLAAAEHGCAGLSPAVFAQLLRMEADGALTATQAKTVLHDMLALLAAGTPVLDPVAIAKEHGFEALAGGEVELLVDELIAAHPSEFDRLKAGDAKVTGFFVGLAMQRSAKKADGKVVTALLRTRAGLP